MKSNSPAIRPRFQLFHLISVNPHMLRAVQGWLPVRPVVSARHFGSQVDAIRRPSAPLFDHLVGAGEQRISSRSALAVLRLITSSNLVGCTTGRSPAF